MITCWPKKIYLDKWLTSTEGTLHDTQLDKKVVNLELEKEKNQIVMVWWLILHLPFEFYAINQEYIDIERVIFFGNVEQLQPQESKRENQNPSKKTVKQEDQQTERQDHFCFQ